MTQLDPRPTPGGGGALLPRVDPIERMPLLILYPHARCNCRCVMCDIWKTRDRFEVSVEAIRALLPELARLGTTRVVLSGGEALMHARPRELCAELHEAGIGVTLLTSGLLLSRDAPWIPDLVDDVVVSLDGPREVHDRIRNVPRAFDRLAEGVAALRARSADLVITARCTVQRVNAAHLLETARAARAIGCTRVSFLAADLAAGAFRHEGDVPDLAPGDLDLLAAQIEALFRELPRAFLAESREKLHERLVAHFRGSEGARVCNAPWVSSVIEADGTVRPCFFHPPIGNIHAAGSLAAVLNSEKALAFRRQLDPATDPVCRRCVCSLALREARSESSTTPAATNG